MKIEINDQRSMKIELYAQVKKLFESTVTSTYLLDFYK